MCALHRHVGQLRPGRWGPFSAPVAEEHWGQLDLPRDEDRLAAPVHEGRARGRGSRLNTPSGSRRDWGFLRAHLLSQQKSFCSKICEIPRLFQRYSSTSMLLGTYIPAWSGRIFVDLVRVQRGGERGWRKGLLITLLIGMIILPNFVTTWLDNLLGQFLSIIILFI